MRWIIIPLTILTAECGGVADLSEPKGEELTLPGILAFGGTTADPLIALRNDGTKVLLTEEVARVGEEVTIVASTLGFCKDPYSTAGAYETRVEVREMEVEIRPIDRVRRTRLEPGAACPGALFQYRHEVTLVPEQAGPMVVRVVGRRIEADEHAAVFGEPVTLADTLRVEP